PTVTIYGFHCAASRLDAVERIRMIKARAGRSGFILLAGDLDMAGNLVARWPGSSEAILAGAWPAPLTAILPARRTVPEILAPNGAVAVRVPAHEHLRALIMALGEPIVSTSVNAAGRAPITRIADTRRSFPGLEAYISRRGRASGSPSTIVDFTSRIPRLVRAGAYRWPAGE
ncbi:MAG: L-threonylcarbamoyladenylate synthase, partial [Candidatus Krumholzibacteria bacterium]|nr:L-threonylcarbamoyladenylate synthase [Candidatus Krumholzibacteria bacterium]